MSTTVVVRRLLNGHGGRAGTTTTKATKITNGQMVSFS